MMRVAFVFLVALLCGVLSLRAPAAEAITHRSCAKLTQAYLRKPPREAIAQFLQQDLDTQYAIYLCGARYVEPPVLYLAGPFASEGEKAALFLKAKLATSLDDQAIVDIARVLVEMQRQRTYNVMTDVGLMSLLSKRVEGMQDAYWREQAQNTLTPLHKE
jgi:hypothetical protein